MPSEPVISASTNCQRSCVPVVESSGGSRSCGAGQVIAATPIAHQQPRRHQAAEAAGQRKGGRNPAPPR